MFDGKGACRDFSGESFRRVTFRARSLDLFWLLFHEVARVLEGQVRVSIRLDFGNRKRHVAVVVAAVVNMIIGATLSLRCW
jgi:hypothetical protein